MSHVRWEDSHSVGIKEVDDQHKRLIEIFNMLQSSVDQGASVEEIDEIIEDLIDYSIFHFGTEEALLEKHLPDLLDEHRKEHQTFVDKVRESRTQLDSGELSTSDLISFLNSWIEHHMKQSDKELCSIQLSESEK